MSTITQQEFGIAFHCHHKRLIEVVTGFSERVRYIQSDKPANEWAERKRLFQMVPDDLLPPGVQAALGPARDAWTKLESLGDDYRAKLKLLDKDDEVGRNLLDDDYWAKRIPLTADHWTKRGLLSTAAVANMPALEALHKQLCKDCPWDGTTIFPKEKP